ncbi:type I methionyl aminopeptidase [Actinomadura namibiensis]|uniref:Methionine aminopeptidase n=1 Tax=Actinomadura namibiensis TaxID=182080 RepID=A0A7W3LTD9_ACTNM|nr:type I methionyl aminopeptidase [Actinomadura namibiensis]MBA8953963.1 methionyl aminopeptidase [Actinomadura namibiensis]
MVTYRSPREWKIMREAGRAVARTLAAVRDAAEPGVPLAELEAVAARTLKRMEARPSFLGYRPSWTSVPYPGTVCVSVNEVVVHGIPHAHITLEDGDVVSVDCGAEVGGYHGDAAITFVVGTADAGAERLLAATAQALDDAVAAARPGNRMGDVSHAVDRIARANGYGVLDGWGGHGIGTSMHEDPPVPNRGSAGRGLRLREGLTIAIEPMFHEGGEDATRVLDDGWSIVTADGSRAAHFEHTVAVTADGPRVLTLP